VIHLVCDCGTLVSLQPPAGARTLSCRACGRVLDVPDPASPGIGDEEPGRLPLPAAGQAPVHATAAAPHRIPVPAFASDGRLDTQRLEREAARQGALGTIVLLGGAAAGAGLALLPPWSPPARSAAAAAVLFAAVAAWSAFRASRASCLAAVALAQRQGEILRAMERG
jgi:hypothetical protein